jgi:hypothetical protein
MKIKNELKSNYRGNHEISPTVMRRKCAPCQNYAFQGRILVFKYSLALDENWMVFGIKRAQVLG